MIGNYRRRFRILPEQGQELCFNGVMAKNKEENLEQKLQQRLVKILKNKMFQGKIKMRIDE